MLLSAIDILKRCVERTDFGLQKKFNKTEPFIHVESGYSNTIINSITQLANGMDPYPIIAVFTEGLKETYSKGNSFIEFNVPKITIAIRTVDDLTESQRLETSFRETLYPIFEEFSMQLHKINFSYDLQITKSDIPYYNESNSNANTFNDKLDRIVIKDLKMKVSLKHC